MNALLGEGLPAAKNRKWRSARLPVAMQRHRVTWLPPSPGMVSGRRRAERSSSLPLFSRRLEGGHLAFHDMSQIPRDRPDKVWPHHDVVFVLENVAVPRIHAR